MGVMKKLRDWTAFRAGLKTFKEIIMPNRNIDPDEQNWTSLGKGKQRDLALGTQDWVTDVAYYQWLTDPLAGRITEMIADFVIGDGMGIRAEDENVQEILDEMWHDEINRFSDQQIPICEEFDVFGELLFLPFVNEVSGLVQFGRLDPSFIKDVVPHPKFPQFPITVRLKPNLLVDQSGETITELNIIRVDRDPASPTVGMLAGDCMYFAQNKIGSKRRGHTQAMRTHEWVDLYQKRIFNEGERQETQNAVIYDVTLTGANDKAVKDFLTAEETPKQASIRAHTDKVKWDVLSPDLKSSDFAEGNRQFLQQVLGARGIPEHYFALGGDVNFATAKAMSEPTLRMFKRQQRQIKNIFHGLGTYQIDRSIQAKRLSANVDRTFEVTSDEISNVDMQAVSSSIVQVAVALQTAEAQSWISKPESAKAFSKLFGQTGVEVEALDDAGVPTQLLKAAEAFQEVVNKRKKRRGNAGGY